MPSVGAMLYRAGVGGSPKPAGVRPSGPCQQSIDVVDDSDDGLRSASAFDISSSSDSPAREARARKRRKSGKAKQVAPTRKKRKSSATAMAADGDDEFKDRGVWAAKYRLLVLKWWAKFIAAQLCKDGASKQLSLPNAAAWVVKRLASKKNNSLKPLKYDAVHYLMDTVRAYMSDRVKIKEHSTGLSPQDISVAERNKDSKKAADWRMTADEMAKLVETAKNILARTGGTCKTTPMTYGRAASRSAVVDGNTTKGAGTKDGAGKSKATNNHSDSDSEASIGGKSGTPSSSSSSDCDGGVLPPCVRSRTARRAPALSPTALPPAQRGGASGRSRRSLTADEDGRAVLGDDGAMMAIIESTRSSASARAAQADVAKQTLELQATAAARAAEATLAATTRQYKLDVMREERESREAERRAHAAEQQAAAALVAAQSSVSLEKLRVLKELFLQTRDASILQHISSMPVTGELTSAGTASGVGTSTAGGARSAAGPASAVGGRTVERGGASPAGGGSAPASKYGAGRAHVGSTVGSGGDEDPPVEACGGK